MPLSELPSRRINSTTGGRGRPPASFGTGKTAEGFEIPAVLAVPGGRQRLQGPADLLGGKVANRQDQLAPDTGVGIIGQRQERVEVEECRGGLCGIRLGVLALAVLAAVAAEHSNRLLTDVRIRVLERVLYERLVADHCSEHPEGSGPFVRLAVSWLVRQKGRPEVSGHVKPIQSLDQAPPRPVQGGDIGRLERRDQALDRCEVNLHRLALVPLGRHPEDPADGLVAEGVAAHARVVPVGDEDRAIRRRAGIDGPEPRVVAGEEDLVLGAETGPLAGEREEVDLPRAGVDLERCCQSTPWAEDLPRKP